MGFSETWGVGRNLREWVKLKGNGET